MTTARLDPPLAVILAATFLFSFSLWLRLIGTPWDGWAGLHPDERHMVFVTLDLLRGLGDEKFASMSAWSLWFDPASPLNPRGTGRLYVYGEWPLLLVTFYCKIVGVSDWGGVTQAGRIITALVDGSTVLAVFILAQMVLRPARAAQRHSAALMAAGLYALAPTAMQLANFYTVDAWLVAFSTWALVPMLALAQGRRGWATPLCAGALAGLALACKLPALALAAPGLLAVAMVARCRGGRAAALVVTLAFAAAVLVFRLANPFAFAGPGFFGLMPSPKMLENFAEVRRFVDSPLMPPNLQWLAGYSAVALLRDLALFGLGPAIVAGMLLVPDPVVRGITDRRALLILAAAVLAQAVFASSLGPLALRYFAPLLGPCAVFAGIGLGAVRPRLWLPIWLLAAVWATGSVRLHSGEHPRLIGTEWMRRLPEGTRIGFETDWDEGLPVSRFVPPGVQAFDPPGPFEFIPLRLTDIEHAGTPARLAEALDQADYLSISSGRQIEVLPRLAEQFAVATRYYAALTSGALCFERVFHADRGFPIPFLGFDDRFTQEPWRVYDHPIVSIWKKQPCFERSHIQDILSGGG